MTYTLSGSSVDGPHVVWSAYWAAVFAVLMAAGWWRARREGAAAAMTALLVPVAVGAAFGVTGAVKPPVAEDRPCRRPALRTPEACPARGNWSFPGNHTAIAFAAAVALFFVSRRPGTAASVCALAMAASRVWVGVHHPRDVVAGAALGGLVGHLATTAVLRRWPTGLADRLSGTWLRPLLVPGAA
ncbi:phosphatase PAP2 family protein [Streptomyces sp. NPDC053069]|uniref:phosphatase PAP2 family protein n=1 Tax=Streptomyces sp. NPDC053069 TaxID=3365695 RepID=UPI0037D0E8F2